jgi:tripartite-type tricarboxylate transporter receptor subunit TctC
MVKNIFSLLIVASLFLCNSPLLFAQKFPDRPINLVLSNAAGDRPDIGGRMLAEEMSKLLKVPVVVMNKPGAGATIATDAVVKSKKDGYTILFTDNAAIITAKIFEPETVPYDSFKDLTPLGLFWMSPTGLVLRKDIPCNTLKELVEYGKKNPQKLRCGTIGVTSLGAANVELLRKLTGMDMSVIPFKGGAPVITALLGGHIEAGAQAMPAYFDHLKTGALKGIVTSLKLPEFPNIPTLKSLGYEQELFQNWTAFYAPAGVPADVTDTLAKAIEKSIEKLVQDPVSKGKLINLGLYPAYEPPAKLTARMNQEYKTLEELSKKMGIMK